MTTDLTPSRLEEISSLTREDIDAHAIVRTHRVMAALHLAPALAARVIELERENARLREEAEELRQAREVDAKWEADLKRVLFMAAASNQGGNSEAGAEIAELLNVPFPLRMSALAEAAKRDGFDPDQLWPWLKPMQARAALEAAHD